MHLTRPLILALAMAGALLVDVMPCDVHPYM